MARESDWQRRLKSAESAGRLLDELGIDPTRRVDVFSLCEAVGLWIAFVPLRNLLGAFIPEGVGGVLVTTQRPATIQRFTAAHELAHWRLEGGGLALDAEEHVLGPTPAERERLAQTFAASLLMPPPLVFSVLARVGASRREIAPHHAYAVAREAGVSYEASIRQLVNLKVMNRSHARALLTVSPLDIKRSLARGRRPVDGWADVWPLDEQWNDQTLTVNLHDEFAISLPEASSTGYRWMFAEEAELLKDRAESPPPPEMGKPPSQVERRRFEALLQSTEHPATHHVRSELEGLDTGQSTREVVRILPDFDVVSDDYLPRRAAQTPHDSVRGERQRLVSETDADRQRPKVGGTGRRFLGVRSTKAGSTTVQLRYVSPFVRDSVAGEFRVHALVEPRRVGFDIDQLAEDPAAGWVNEARLRGFGTEAAVGVQHDS